MKPIPTEVKSLFIGSPPHTVHFKRSPWGVGSNSLIAQHSLQCLFITTHIHTLQHVFECDL